MLITEVLTPREWNGGVRYECMLLNLTILIRSSLSDSTDLAFEHMCFCSEICPVARVAVL